MWWIDPGLTPGAHQSFPVTFLLSWAGKRKYSERLMGRDEDRGILLSSYCHRTQIRLGECSYIHYAVKSKEDNEK